jgi:hypothetical protein
MANTQEGLRAPVPRALAGRIDRTLAHAASKEGRYTRAVDSFTLHPTALDFRALCQRVLRPSTRYLLLDLDRTTHRGVNLGELLGWEIASYKFFGPTLSAQRDAPRVAGRLINDPSAPQRFPAYILDSARRWGFPGLSYLLWGKLAARHELLGRWSYRKFGSEPMRAVQRLPQTALLHEIATLPKPILRQLAQRVWELARPRQVIERADLAWVRERCPGIQIILTSASPRPMVELAGELLGVDATEYSSTTDLGDRYASPYWVDRRFALERLEHIAPPEEVRINSGHTKIERLLGRYPDLLDDGVESVGISDTGYGEDHSWAQYLSVVVDVNSTAPFPPVVAFDSPLREVHSAQLLTHDERAAGAPTAGKPVELRATELKRCLAGTQRQLEQLCAASQQIAGRLSAARGRLVDELRQERAAISCVVHRYNAAPEHEQKRVLAQLRQALRREAAVQRRLAACEVPLSLSLSAITAALRLSRSELGHAAEAVRSAVERTEQPPAPTRSSLHEQTL